MSLGKQPARRPHVTTNFAASVDGKVTFARPGPFALSSREDKRRMAQLRAEADAVMWGAGSVLVDQPVARVRRPELAAARRARGQAPQPLNVLITGSARVHPDNRYFADPDVPRLVVTTDRADPARLAAYRARAEVLVEQGPIDLAALLSLLERRGVRQLLCEGGPTLTWSLLEGDLVDELRVTVVPFIVGGETARTMVEGRGFGPESARRLELVSVEPVGAELFLTYRVRGR
jgi:2,5-diamino-6-(ribosylamino)-4(3H)-pyrimidinone 5'-phosphate reductase